MSLRTTARHAKVPTIHDVARAAGVATSTVSRALTGEPRVSEATRQRVRLVAVDLGYRPSRSARALRSARTGTIGLLSPNLENPTAYDHLRATVRAAFEAGYTVSVADCQDSIEIQEAELARMREYRVDGLILGRGTLQVTRALVDLAASEVPMEPALDADLLRRLVGQVITPYRDRSTLDATAATIGYRRLVDLGHRRFAVFLLSSGPMGYVRQKALDDVLAAAGIDAADVLSVAVSDPAECVGQMQALAASAHPPTAIVVARGRLTPYILEGIYSSGLRIPEDVSLLNFGDSQWHKAYAPPISVIRHDYAAVARRTVERMVARIEGHEVPEDSRRPSEFVMRGSMGPAPVGASLPGSVMSSLR